MATSAVFAHGTFLKIGDGGGTEVFTTVAEVNKLKGPMLKLNTIDVTNHSSGGWKEFIAGLLEAGDVTFTINFQPQQATHSNTSGLLRDLRTKVKRNFQLVLPDAGVTTWAFTALVVGFPVNAPEDGALTVDVTLRISGQPTLA
jgi:predicted secreted protein